MDQLIISVGREFASGGHDIAEIIAKHYDIPLYDKNILEEIAKEKGVDLSGFANYDERKKNVLFSRTVNGYDNSTESALANMQFDFIKKKAEDGESFVVCGRCAESLLKDNPNMISFFILADEDKKIERIVKMQGCSHRQAARDIKKSNEQRKLYHNLYCDGKWGDSRNYDMSINSSRLGIENTAQFLIKYIEERR